jgi:hypothetical protein
VAAAIDVYSMGRVLREQDAHGKQHGGPDSGPLPPYLQRLLASGEFPHLAPLITSGRLHPEPGMYDDGLRWLLDGIEAQYGSGGQHGGGDEHGRQDR